MRHRAPLLFVTVLVIATAGLVYELIAATLASYVLGDSVTQFSTTIGLYLFAMGIGSYLSKFVTNASVRFVEIELAAALLGGFSAPILFVAFAHTDWFPVFLYGTILVVGALVGLEIPLVIRILRDELKFEDLIAKVLTVDYLGALAGSLLFAVILMPSLGLNRTSLLFGMLSCAVGLMSTWVLADLLTRAARIRLRIKGLLLAGLLAAGFVHAEEMTRFGEQAFYADPIIYAKQTPYQRIVLTRGRRSLQLFLNGNLQFSSSDEYRYHEALVHPAFSVAPRHARVLVLGGGDGLVLREVFKYPDVEEVTLVDLDEGVTRMGREVDLLVELNERALFDPRVELVHDDAMVWLDENGAELEPYDVILIDFPDPNNFSLGKLYTNRFYDLVRRVMHEDSAVSVQSTSPMMARRSFWCIERTMASSGLHTAPYHATVPSFGEWGYVLAMTRPFDPPTELEVEDLRFLNEQTLSALFVFPDDMAPVDVEPNRLDNQRLVQYYEQEWSRWN